MVPTKSRLSVYLEPQLCQALEAYAERRAKSRSLIAEAAIASFLSDTTERQEGVLARRLDRLDRRMERLERDLGISVETLALFVRFWLTTTPALPEPAQAAARAKGNERYAKFVEALGRRLAAGKTILREIPEEPRRDESVPPDS